jgi:hypothetical protein
LSNFGLLKSVLNKTVKAILLRDSTLLNECHIVCINMNSKMISERVPIKTVKLTNGLTQVVCHAVKAK